MEKSPSFLPSFVFKSKVENINMLSTLTGPSLKLGFNTSLCLTGGLGRQFENELNF